MDVRRGFLKGEGDERRTFLCLLLGVVAVGAPDFRKDGFRGVVGVTGSSQKWGMSSAS